jgi:hypothetical protein
VNLWVDDIRDAPDSNWIVARTYQDAMTYAPFQSINVLSLDHDLGTASEHDAIKIVLYMCEFNDWPNEVRLHTANPVGRDNMQALINRYGPYR